MGDLIAMNKSSWSLLRNYEARDLIKQKFKERHNREANAELRCEISCAFIQWR